MPNHRQKLPLLLFLLALLISVPLVLGFLGPLHPFFDAFAHFRAHLAILMGLLALPLFFTKLRREGAMILLFAVLAFGTTWDAARNFMSGSADAQAIEPEGARYSLIQINLQHDNPDPKQLLQMIAKENPDIITYQEATHEWAQWITILEGRYPYHAKCTIDGFEMRVGILSRRPFSTYSEQSCLANGRFVTSLIDLGGTHVTIASFHAPWPWPSNQTDIITALESDLIKLNGPTLIAGDFNASPWSHAVQRVAQASGTVPAANIGGTWLPKFLPVSLVPYLGLSLDQILISREIEAPQIKLSDDIGSDHLPVRIDFSVPAPVRHDEDEADTQSV